jgi:tRNA A-37 threonylcarbamoyl transferase component Bud32/tetratricopeptide (TPR) repeat protein
MTLHRLAKPRNQYYSSPFFSRPFFALISGDDLADLSVSPNDVLATRYRIERELGQGGMATVYLARDLRHDSLVAVKVLKPELAQLLGGERFTREIRITAGLQHPNILPVFDSGQIDGIPYYVMPYVEGETLAHRLGREGQLPVDQALEIASEVADGLACAHEAGFVHRDIKPSNILLAHGHAVISDFGIAHALDAAGDPKLTATGTAIGTAAYMSPEQAAGDKVDGRSDIYSLGCVLYEMLAGDPPFTGSSQQAVIARHWADPMPSIRSVRNTVSDAIEATIRKAMAKSPADRFATAREFKQTIDRLKTGEQVVAGHARRPVRKVAIPAAAALGLVIAVALAWRYFPSGEALDRNRVMVYPLIVPGNFKGSGTVGEDVATMIGSALDGTGPLRWIDSWPLLDASHRRDIRTLTLADARSLARSKRCAFFLTGRIVGRGDSAEVLLELNDVSGDSTVARGKAGGPTDAAWRTGLRAVNDVLPTLIPGGAPEMLAEWSDRAPGAVASFLLGESAFRQVHLAEALAHYRDALKADSTFGLAAIRGAQAATWNHRAIEAESFIDVALKQKMSPRYAHFALGYEAYLNGLADSAIAEFRRSLAIDPELSVAWMQLGEVYTHLLPAAGNPDSLAQVAFDEAHRLDPLATNLLFHSIEIRLRRGDTRGARPLLRDFLAAAPDTILAQQVRIMDDCVVRGPAAVDWRKLSTLHPFAVLAAANSLKGGGAQLPCAARAFESIVRNDTASNPEAQGRQWNALIGLQSVLLAQGRVQEATAQVDASIARGGGGTSLFLQDAPVTPQLAERARTVALHDEAQFGPNYAGCRFPTRLWQLGLWEAYAGRPAVVTAIARDLAARAQKSGSVFDRLLARSMEAHATLARGDTTGALRLLAELIPAGIPADNLVWDLSTPRPLDRLRLAQLLFVKGQFQRAIDVASVFDSPWPSIYILYLPASLDVRARAAASMGETSLASHYRNRLAALGGDRVVASR